MVSLITLSINLNIKFLNQVIAVLIIEVIFLIISLLLFKAINVILMEKINILVKITRRKKEQL